MAGFSSVRQFVDADDLGNNTITTFRKAPSQTTVAGQWFDLSMSPGNPSPQYYASAPLVAVQMKYSDQGGLFHGGAVSPANKYIQSLGIMANAATALPMPVILCDYLMYYPFIDDGTTDEQLLTNSVALPRYTDGKGVQIMAVSVAGRTGGQTFSVKYTNQDGVSGRVTSLHTQTSAVAVGTLLNQSTTATDSIKCPFLTLQSGDTGVQSIQSVTMTGTDVGLFTLVLVKPLMQLQMNEITAYSEKQTITQHTGLLQIQDDAYLNFIAFPNGSLAATQLNGILETVWN